jgi:hypothetical protein
LLQKLKVPAYYKIIGGIIGIGAIGYSLMRQPVTGGLLVVFVVACTLNVFSCGCRWVLLKNTSKGLFLSLINLALQAVVFVSGAYAFK